MDYYYPGKRLIKLMNFIRKQIHKAIQAHFDGLVDLDQVPRTKPYLHLDCLEEDIELAIFEIFSIERIKSLFSIGHK